MPPSVSVIFKCVEVNEETATQIFSQKKIVTIKGFASRMDPHLPLEKELEEFVSTFDILAFDGDELREDSFTRYIAALVHARCTDSSSSGSCKEIIALHAVKFASEVQDLIDSWDNVVVSFRHDATLNQLSMITRKLGTEETFCDENVHLTEVFVFYRTVSGLPHPDDQGQRYVELGIHHLSLVNPSTVVTLGGGKILQDEFDTEMGKEECKRIWHLFEPISRRKIKQEVGVTKEEVEICALVAVGHPRLIKHIRY